MLLKVLRCQLTYQGQAETNAEAWFNIALRPRNIVQELCESRGGRPGLSVLTSLLVSVDVKNY